MSMSNDLSHTIQLTADEAALISQSATPDPDPRAFGRKDSVRSSEADPSDFHLLRRFVLFACVFHGLIAFAEALLDLEHVDSDLQTQFVHYAVTYFWLNASGAMLLTAWMVIEKVQARLSSGPSRI